MIHSQYTLKLVYNSFSMVGLSRLSYLNKYKFRTFNLMEGRNVADLYVIKSQASARKPVFREIRFPFTLDLVGKPSGDWLLRPFQIQALLQTLHVVVIRPF
jgi:hypothetical protein